MLCLTMAMCHPYDVEYKKVRILATPEGVWFMKRLRCTATQGQINHPSFAVVAAALSFALMAVQGCGRGKEQAESDASPSRPVQVAREKERPDVTLTAPKQVRNEPALKADEPASPVSPQVQSWSISESQVKRSEAERPVSGQTGDGPISRKESSKLSERWMTGSPEKRAQAIRDANLGTRALPAELARIAREGTDEGLQTLLILSREPTGKGLEALMALRMLNGSTQRAAAAAELERRIKEGDVRVVVPAIESYVALRGDGSIDEARRFIEINYRRQDGYGVQVCSAAVNALGKLDTESANTLLMQELNRASEPDWIPDYGSVVIKALVKPDSRNRPSPAVLDALEKYARGLKERMPGHDNPPGRQYYEEKIAEVRELLGDGANGQAIEGAIER